MQTSGGPIVVFFKFPTRMQSCEDNFECTLSAFRMLVDWDAAPIVGDGNGSIVGMERYLDVRCVPVYRFVDGVVDQFPNEMMKTMSPDAPDIHTRAFSDRFKAFENRDVFRCIFTRHHPFNSDGSS